MILNAEYVPGRRFVRVSYEKPSGEEVRLEFEIERKPTAEVEDWIEQELIRQLRERAVACWARQLRCCFRDWFQQEPAGGEDCNVMW